MWGGRRRKMRFWRSSSSFTPLSFCPRWCGSMLSMSRSTTCSVTPRPTSSRASTRQLSSKSWRMSSGGFVTSSPSYRYCGSWLEKATESRSLLTPKSACSLGKVSSPTTGLTRSVVGLLVIRASVPGSVPKHGITVEPAEMVDEISSIGL